MFHAICYMKIIIGLGNPGEKYINTRHNVGFMLIDKLKQEWNFPDFEFNKKFNAEISIKSNYSLSSSPAGGRGCRVLTTGEEKSEKDNRIMLVKPQTFMNLSGTSIRAILDFHKITPENLIVVHDDVDVALGKYKVATDSSSAGHNGVQNIIDQLGTQEFCRIRVGIGKTPEEKESCPISAHDFVLSKFSTEELEKIEKISGEILKKIEKLLQQKNS